MKLKKKNPEVSIIMNCFNGEKYLEKSISSVINQTYKNWELIFWNNKSSDASEKIFKSFKDSRLKYFESNNFQKLYKARNNAIKKSRGRFITFIDTDDWWLKRKIEKQLGILKKNKSYSFIYSNWFVFDQNKKTKKIFNHSKLPSGKISQNLLNKYEINIGTVMIKKKVLQKFRFNENYEIIGDFDLFIKLSLKYMFLSIQEPLSFYRLHNENLSKKYNLHARELDNWIKKNYSILKKKKLSISSQILYLFKLKVKNLIGYK